MTQTKRKGWLGTTYHLPSSHRPRSLPHKHWTSQWRRGGEKKKKKRAPTTPLTTTFPQEAVTVYRRDTFSTPSPAFPLTDDWLLDEEAALSVFMCFFFFVCFFNIYFLFYFNKISPLVTTRSKWHSAATVVTLSLALKRVSRSWLGHCWRPSILCVLPFSRWISE